MSEVIEVTVIDRIKWSKMFDIQVDESTDITNSVVLLVIESWRKLFHFLSERTNADTLDEARIKCY